MFITNLMLVKIKKTCDCDNGELWCDDGDRW